MWSDNETSIDYIDFHHYVEVIASIINDIDLLPCSIGVHGDWGSGKSSLMQMIEKRYEGKENYLVVKFNGWQFEGYEDAKTVLMGRIIEVIAEEKGALPKVKEFATKLLNRIDFWKLTSSVLKIGVGLVTSPVGVAALAAKDVLNAAKDVDFGNVVKDAPEEDGKSLRKSIHDFHREFNELLTLTEIERLIVLIDDLDRCLPDTVIGTLEAIKLFLFTPKTAFIIGADEHLIRHAVRKRFEAIPGEERELGREYLEKLIQFPVRIHQLSAAELETYINLLFSKMHLEAASCEELRTKVIQNRQPKSNTFPYNIKNAKVLLGDSYSSMQETLFLSQQITPVLVRGLKGNPRLCKRFLNTMLMRQLMAKSKNIELKNSIFAKLMLLEYFKPEQFKTVYSSLHGETGISLFLSELEAEITKSVPQKIKGSVELETEGQEPDRDLWLKDPWLLTWLRIEPKLGDEDLNLYFYFSRDRLTASSVFANNMNAALQEIFDALTSTSDILVKKVESTIVSLSSAEASGLFGSITETINAEEKIQVKKRLISRLFDFCILRKELMSEFITFIERIPEQNIDSSMVVKFGELSDNAQYKSSASKILTKWAKSSDNTQLASLVKSRMEKKKKNGNV